MTGLVTPPKVRSPVILSLPGAPETDVDLNVIVGNFSTLKKSADLRCLSRASTAVLTVVGVERGFDAGLGWVLFVPVDCARDAANGAADGAHRQVANGKVRLRVVLIDGPARSLSGSCRADQ